MNKNTYNKNNSSDNYNNNNENNNSNNDCNDNKECRYVDWNITKIKIKVVFELIVYGVDVSRDRLWSYSMIWFFY